MAPRDLILLIAANFVWALTLIATKLGVAEIPPLFFTTLRFIVLALILFPIMNIHKGQFGRLFAIAMTAGGLQFACIYVGLSLADDVSAIAVTGQLNVPFAAILSVLILREYVGWRRWTGIILAFFGIVYFSYDPRVMSYIDGVIFSVSAAFIAAVSMILMRQIKGIGVFDLQGWIAMLSWPPLLALSLMVEGSPFSAIQNASWVAWTALGFTIIFSSLMAHGALFYLLQRYEVNQVSPLMLLTPIFSLILGVGLMGDELSPRMIVGAAIALVGIFIVSVRQPAYVQEGR